MKLIYSVGPTIVCKSKPPNPQWGHWPIFQWQWWWKWQQWRKLWWLWHWLHLTRCISDFVINHSVLKICSCLWTLNPIGINENMQYAIFKRIIFKAPQIIFFYRAKLVRSSCFCVMMTMMMMVMQNAIADLYGSADNGENVLSSPTHFTNWTLCQNVND